MSIRITDPALVQALRQVQGDALLTDADGQPIGRFSAADWLKPPPGFESAFTEDELERRRQRHQSGRPLREILGDLEARG